MSLLSAAAYCGCIKKAGASTGMIVTALGMTPEDQEFELNKIREAKQYQKDHHLI